MSVDDATIEAFKKAVEGDKDTHIEDPDTSSFAAALSAAVSQAEGAVAAPAPAGDLDASIYNQLAAAIGEHTEEPAHVPEISHSEPPAGDSLGLDVDRQLLLDSIKSIISGDSRDANRSSSAPPQQTTLTQDEQAMQEALLMATRQLENTGQPAAYQYGGYQQGAFPMEGEADAATLQVVQSVLQDLGGHWGDMDGGRGKRRARHASPMTEEDRLRIREDNRNRKKRWRDSNADRNRDNDLRGRITRRANGMFGTVDTKQKLDWIEDEYHKRRERRMLREGTGKFRDHALGALGGPNRSLARDQLSALFRESNAILSANKPVTAGFVPSHLITGPMVPCPARPAYDRGYSRHHRKQAASRDTMGCPPVLEDLIVKLE